MIESNNKIKEQQTEARVFFNPYLEIRLGKELGTIYSNGVFTICAKVQKNG